MTNIKYLIVNHQDADLIALIANWYYTEWNIPADSTIKKLKALSANNSEFQVLMTLDDLPIATGGLYNHVGLLDIQPKYKIYKNWLALVYTLPAYRKNGFGSLICKNIQSHSKSLGLKEIFLFTHTAENLYKQLGWQQLERLSHGGKDIVIMKKDI